MRRSFKHSFEITQQGSVLNYSPFWLLATGTWDDAGKWADNAVWID